MVLVSWWCCDVVAVVVVVRVLIHIVGDHDNSVPELEALNARSTVHKRPLLRHD